MYLLIPFEKKEESQGFASIEMRSGGLHKSILIMNNHAITASNLNFKKTSPFNTFLFLTHRNIWLKATLNDSALNHRKHSMARVTGRASIGTTVGFLNIHPH